jgi:hypothetical protein
MIHPLTLNFSPKHCPPAKERPPCTQALGQNQRGRRPVSGPDRLTSKPKFVGCSLLSLIDPHIFQFHAVPSKLLSPSMTMSLRFSVSHNPALHQVSIPLSYNMFLLVNSTSSRTPGPRIQAADPLRHHSPPRLSRSPHNSHRKHLALAIAWHQYNLGDRGVG